MAPPPFLISFDPGLREAGLAVYTKGKLTHAFLIRNPEKIKRDGPAWREMAKEVYRTLNAFCPNALTGAHTLVSEIPQVYREGKSANVDPSDLTNLSGVVGCVIGRLDIYGPEEVHTFVPAQWKGQVPKDIHNKRILAKLDEEERKVLDAVKCPASLKHNVIDAVGIGLFFLGRIGGVLK